MIAELGCIPSPDQIDAVLAFEQRLPVRGDVDQHVFASTFMEVLYTNGFVVSYDWGAWQDEAHRYYYEPERLRSADLGTIQRLLTLHARKDRFSENHFDWFVATDHAREILARLRQLRETSV